MLGIIRGVGPTARARGARHMVMYAITQRATRYEPPEKPPPHADVIGHYRLQSSHGWPGRARPTWHAGPDRTAVGPAARHYGLLLPGQPAATGPVR